MVYLQEIDETSRMVTLVVDGNSSSPLFSLEGQLSTSKGEGESGRDEG